MKPAVSKSKRALFKLHVPQPCECSVCIGNIRKGFLLPCGHTFHSKCIRGWTDRGRRSCPNCRAKFTIPESQSELARCKNNDAVGNEAASAEFMLEVIAIMDAINAMHDE